MAGNPYADITNDETVGEDWAPTSLDTFVSGVLGFSPSIAAFPTTTGSGVNLEMNRESAPLAWQGTGRHMPRGGKKVSVNAALGAIMNLPKQEVIAWKDRLYNAGLYDPSLYSKGVKPRQTGVFDSEDVSAMQQLMYTALRAPEGYTVQSLLDEMGANSPYSAKNNYGRQRPTATAQTVDPATVRGYAEAAAETLLGRRLDENEMSSLVGRMVAQQTGAAVGAAQAQIAASEGGGGVVTSQNVDVAARTQQTLELEHAAEAEAKRFANGYDVFMKLVTGGA